MRKPLAVGGLVALVVVLAGSAAPQLEGPALIRVTQRLESTHRVGRHDVITAYIRDRRTRRIGWSASVCVPIGRGEILGPSSWYCSTTFAFPLGRIVASGVRGRESPSYVFAVTGGTGFYHGVGGTVFVRGVGSTVELLLFNLE